jgi:hypothetical protein
MLGLTTWKIRSQSAKVYAAAWSSDGANEYTPLVTPAATAWSTPAHQRSSSQVGRYQSAPT